MLGGSCVHGRERLKLVLRGSSGVHLRWGSSYHTTPERRWHWNPLRRHDGTKFSQVLNYGPFGEFGSHEFGDSLPCDECSVSKIARAPRLGVVLTWKFDAGFSGGVLNCQENPLVQIIYRRVSKEACKPPPPEQVKLTRPADKVALSRPLSATGHVCS